MGTVNALRCVGMTIIEKLPLSFRNSRALQLNIILNTDLLNQVELRF